MTFKIQHLFSELEIDVQSLPPNGITMEQYVSVDDDFVVFDAPTDEQIIQSLTGISQKYLVLNIFHKCRHFTE